MPAGQPACQRADELVHLPVCVQVSVRACLPVCQHVCQRVCLYVCVSACQCVSVLVCQRVSVSVCQRGSVSVCQCVSVSLRELARVLPSRRHASRTCCEPATRRALRGSFVLCVWAHVLSRLLCCLVFE